MLNSEQNEEEWEPPRHQVYLLANRHNRRDIVAMPCGTKKKLHIFMQQQLWPENLFLK